MEDRDYARSIRRGVELSIRGGQYALRKILLAETMKAAHDKYRVETEKMEDLEFQYFQNLLNAAETRVISQQVKSAGG